MSGGSFDIPQLDQALGRIYQLHCHVQQQLLEVCPTREKRTQDPAGAGSRTTSIWVDVEFQEKRARAG